MESSVEEIERLIRKAERRLETSLFRRKPDFEGAINYYTAAAVGYRTNRCLQEAAELYRKVAELNRQIGSHFASGQNYECCASLHKVLEQYELMAEAVSLGYDQFKECGAPDTAVHVYREYAKILEKPLPARAAEFYESAAETCEVEDKYHEAAELCYNAAGVWARLHRFADAERMLRLYITCTEQANPNSIVATVGGYSDNSAVPRLCARAVVALVLMKLHQEDEVAAQKIFTEAATRWRLAETEEYFVLQRLIDAYSNGDAATAAQILKTPCFRNLDLVFFQLLKEIRFPSNADIPVDEHLERNESRSEIQQSHLSQTVPMQPPAPRSSSKSPVSGERPDDTVEILSGECGDEEDIC